MRVRKKERLIFIILFLLVAGAAIVGGFMVTKTIRNAYELQIKGLESTIADNSHTVYVALEDIPAGKVIEENMVSEEIHLMSIGQDLFKATDIGSKALVDIPQNTILSSALIAKGAKEETDREVEYTCIYLSSALVQGDFIDVRIRYQNGEDFVVMAKKQIEQLSLASSSCYLVVSEVDQQMMASAVTDTNRYDAVIYATAYPDPTVQEASNVTYPARYDNITKIAEIENREVLEEEILLRGDLELRLAPLEDATQSGTALDISNFTKVKEANQSNSNGSGINGTLQEDKKAQ